MFQRNMGIYLSFQHYNSFFLWVPMIRRFSTVSEVNYTPTMTRISTPFRFNNLFDFTFFFREFFQHNLVILQVKKQNFVLVKNSLNCLIYKARIFRCFLSHVPTHWSLFWMKTLFSFETKKPKRKKVLRAEWRNCFLFFFSSLILMYLHYNRLSLTNYFFTLFFPPGLLPPHSRLIGICGLVGWEEGQRKDGSGS